MSRRNEIKEKDALRARFQFSMAQSNTMVASWLKPMKNTPVPDKQSFLDLPIVPQGASLSSLEGSRKIADFMKADPKTGPKPETRASKPMQALMNRVRDTRREKIAKPKPKVKPKPKDDSDSDEDVLPERSVKKGGALTFGKGIKRT